MLRLGLGEVEFPTFRILGAEVQVVFGHVGFIRIERGVDGCLRRAANGSQWQSCMQVGVVQALYLQIIRGQVHLPHAGDVMNGYVTAQLDFLIQPIVEYGGHLGKVAFLRFLLNQRSQGQHLIHGHVQLFRPCLHFCREHIVRLAQQLADDLLCRGRGIHFIGIGCKVALQHILALGNVAGSKHIGDIVVILELFPGFAQVQEFRAVAQHTVGHQLGSELLNGPAGNHGNGAYQRIAVPLGQLVGNFLHGHGLIQGVAAGLNFLSHACKVTVILEHRLGANQICFFQVGGHTAQALTAFHRKGNPCGVCSIHRSQILIVNFIPHGHQQPDNDHQGSGHY